MSAISIAIIGDTHLPRGNRKLPATCVSRLREADLIIHVGDLVTMDVLRELETFGEVVAVHGNVDEPTLVSVLPERIEVKIEEVRLAVVHDAGPTVGRLRRLQRSFPDANAAVFGHSHIPLIERDPASGFQIFNPGSPTDRRRQPHFTMGWAQAQNGRISFEIIDLT